MPWVLAGQRVHVGNLSPNIDDSKNVKILEINITLRVKKTKMEWLVLCYCRVNANHREDV